MAMLISVAKKLKQYIYQLMSEKENKGHTHNEASSAILRINHLIKQWKSTGTPGSHEQYKPGTETNTACRNLFLESKKH